MPTEFPTHDIALVLIALFNCVTAILAWRSHQQGTINAANIGALERNTNSRMDQLVSSTERAAFSAGENKARLAGEATAKDLIIEAAKPKETP